MVLASEFQPYEYRSHDTDRLSMFVKEFLRFVDLSGQVGATAAIRVVEQHELAVLLADLFLVQGALSVQTVRLGLEYRQVASHRRTYGSSRIKEASRRVIRGSNPLFPVSRGLTRYVQNQV